MNNSFAFNTVQMYHAPLHIIQLYIHAEQMHTETSFLWNIKKFVFFVTQIPSPPLNIGSYSPITRGFFESELKSLSVPPKNICTVYPVRGKGKCRHLSLALWSEGGLATPTPFPRRNPRAIMTLLTPGLYCTYHLFDSIPHVRKNPLSNIFIISYGSTARRILYS